MLSMALRINIPSFAVIVGVYVVLHFIFFDQFYKNPLQRGKDAPALPQKYSPFGFVCTLFRMSDDDFQKYCGLDALTFLLFIRLVIKILIWFGLYAITVGILTMWAASEFGDGGEWEGPSGGLARISLANLRSFGPDIGIADWDRWLGALGSAIGCWSALPPSNLH